MAGNEKLKIVGEYQYTCSDSEIVEDTKRYFGPDSFDAGNKQR
jgi:hypothetical protein